ncbi:MAG TPA: hypothetical protein VKV17_20630 [Bryobacteraceae bacterium]|nr:hypothetical protein [Bryobacteraceae bacterium]
MAVSLPPGVAPNVMRWWVCARELTGPNIRGLSRRREAEPLRHFLLHGADVLGSIVQGEMAAAPVRNRGVRFHGVMVLDRGCVDCVDLTAAAASPVLTSPQL